MKRHEDQTTLPQLLAPQEAKEKFIARANEFREEIRQTRVVTGEELEVYTGMSLVGDVISDETFVDSFVKNTLMQFKSNNINADTFVYETIDGLLSVLALPNSNISLSGDSYDQPQE